MVRKVNYKEVAKWLFGGVLTVVAFSYGVTLSGAALSSKSDALAILGILGYASLILLFIWVLQQVIKGIELFGKWWEGGATYENLVNYPYTRKDKVDTVGEVSKDEFKRLEDTFFPPDVQNETKTVGGSLL